MLLRGRNLRYMPLRLHSSTKNSPRPIQPLSYASLTHPGPHLSSNKAGSLGQADHDPAGAKSGLRFCVHSGSKPKLAGVVSLKTANAPSPSSASNLLKFTPLRTYLQQIMTWARFVSINLGWNNHPRKQFPEQVFLTPPTFELG